jgi:glycosyltransferase involved in cell wall biosynthesis
MVGSSGIGVVTRRWISAWSKEADVELTLYGDVLELNGLGLADSIAKKSFGTPVYSPGSFASAFGKAKADILYSPHYPSPIRPKSPLVVTINDCIHATHPKRKRERIFAEGALRSVGKSAAYVTTPSRHTKVQLQTLYGIPAHRLLKVPYGPGLADLEATPIDGLPEEPYLLAVGIDQPHKRWDWVLQAVACIHQRSSEKIPLVAAGLRPKDRDRIVSLSSKLGISDRIVVLDHLRDEQMPTLYRNARALLYPTLIEGFGLPLVEAMTLGVPIVCSNLPPMNEIVGDAALPFAADDSNGFVRAIRECLVSTSLRAKLIEKGQERAAEYSWTNSADAMLSVLRRAHEESLSGSQS